MCTAVDIINALAHNSCDLLIILVAIGFSIALMRGGVKIE